MWPLVPITKWPSRWKDIAFKAKKRVTRSAHGGAGMGSSSSDSWAQLGLKWSLGCERLPAARTGTARAGASQPGSFSVVGQLGTWRANFSSSFHLISIQMDVTKSHTATPCYRDIAPCWGDALWTTKFVSTFPCRVQLWWASGTII